MSLDSAPTALENLGLVAEVMCKITSPLKSQYLIDAVNACIASSCNSRSKKFRTVGSSATGLALAPQPSSALAVM